MISFFNGHRDVYITLGRYRRQCSMYVAPNIAIFVNALNLICKRHSWSVNQMSR